MLFLATALYCEAQPLIETFRLKKRLLSNRFQVYENEQITLIITGVGMISAAIATTYLLSTNGVQEGDRFFNIGICGTSHQGISFGQAFLCHKIIHHDTGYTYYPDILIPHDLQEGTLESFSRPVTFDMQNEVKGDLVDMEGFGCFAAASVFLPPHQLYVVKIVSDLLNNRVSPETATKLVAEQMPAIKRLLHASQQIQTGQQEILNEEDLSLLQQLRDQLHLTATMYHQLIQLATQYKIRSKQNLDSLREYGYYQVTSKQEGKMMFERIKRQLLHS